jgi:HNH endonuclease
MSFEPPLLESGNIDHALAHRLGQFETNEVLRFYARERRANCTFMQLMNLWLIVPCCYNCALVESFDGVVYPYIAPRNWRRELGWHAGEAVLSEAEGNLRGDPDFAFTCQRCHVTLRPWFSDEMSVATLHVEERFAVPLETLGQRRASRALVARIKKLYDYRCFGCEKLEGANGNTLHIDHVLPRSNGGTAAFRNLQPLCSECGNTKGDELPEEVDVFSTLFFRSPPSDAYEGLFW